MPLALERVYAGRGSEAYHPALLLSLLIYGYATVNRDGSLPHIATAMNDAHTLKDALYQQVARIAGAAASPKRLELIELLARAPKSVERRALRPASASSWPVPTSRCCAPPS